jgi:hypothetical protein
VEIYEYHEEIQVLHLSYKYANQICEDIEMEPCNVCGHISMHDKFVHSTLYGN